MKVTMAQYSKGFKSVQGYTAFGTILEPFVKAICPWPEIAAFVYPPLGDLQSLGVVLTFLLLLATTLIVFAFCNRVAKVRYFAAYTLLIASSFLGASCWLATGMGYIRLVHIVKGKTVVVSVGRDRTVMAKTEFPGESDHQMLLEYGQREQDIQDLWTHPSLINVRIRLWFECTLTLVSILALLSLNIYQTVSNP